jgi:Amt family ammonium transporter
VVAGLIVCIAVNKLDNLRVDDPVGTISVHGFGGLWGVLATGLLAHGPVRGLFRGGGSGLLVAQLVGIATLIVWAFGGSWVFFRVLNRIVPMRVEPEVEIGGLDIPETGVPGYPDAERFE